MPDGGRGLRNRILDTGKTQRRSRTSHAQVVDELGRSIVARTYPVGSILPGDIELALRLTVSPPVLRVTLKTLAPKRMPVHQSREGPPAPHSPPRDPFDIHVIA